MALTIDYTDLEVPSGEASRLAGVTYRQLHYWVKQGYIAASAPAKGSGNPWGFSLIDVLKIRALRHIANDLGSNFSAEAVDAVKAAKVSELTGSLVWKQRTAHIELTLSDWLTSEDEELFMLAMKVRGDWEG